MVEVVPGTHVRMRVIRRYAGYNIGDEIAVEFWAGRELEAKRLADPINLLVPRQAGAAEQDQVPPLNTAPLRQPTGIVRK